MEITTVEISENYCPFLVHIVPIIIQKICSKIYVSRK